MRYLPAKPTTVAAYVLKQFDAGVDPDKLLEQASAIEKAHDFYFLSNPVCTSAAQFALSQVSQTAINPPRSWTREEREEFATFPIQAQRAIARGERHRERWFRTAQNKLAEQLKTAPSTAPESSKPVETKESELSNGT